MDFAIAAVHRGSGAAQPAPETGPRDTGLGDEWAVLCLHTRRGVEVAQHLAHFGHRSHAEAFLADLLAASTDSR